MNHDNVFVVGNTDYMDEIAACVSNIIANKNDFYGNLKWMRPHPEMGKSEYISHTLSNILDFANKIVVVKNEDHEEDLESIFYTEFAKSHAIGVTFYTC